MRKVINCKILISALFCLVLSNSFVNGQVYRFKNYGKESGIPDGFIYTLNQDRNGYLWVGTGNGISKFDGFEFFNITFPDSATGRYPTACLKDKKGRLWFGCNDGTLYYSEGNTLIKIEVPEARPISAMLEGPDGCIYIIPQDKSVYKINPDNPDGVAEYLIDNSLVLFSACFTESGDLMLGGQGDIRVYKMTGDSLWNIRTIEGFDYSNILSLHKIKGKDIFLAGTDGNGLFRIELTPGTDLVSRFANHTEIESISVRAITEDTGGDIWLSTNESGIVDMKLSTDNKSIDALRFLNMNSGLPGNSARFVFQDIEGNYWIGLSGDGLSMLNSLAFSFFLTGSTNETNNIIYVNKFYNDYFLGTPSGYFQFDAENNKIRSFVNLRQRAGGNEISSYCVDNENNVWIGTKGGGLYVMNENGVIRRFYYSGNSGQDNISDVEIDKKHIWVGTLNGVIILDRFSGDSLGGYNINNGLPHNSINKVFITTDGKVAVATKTDRLYLIDIENGVTTGKAVMYGTTMNEIFSFCQTRDGSLWAATSGNGIFQFSGDSLRSLTRNEMLMSDYGYSILADSDDRIWVGHERGFSRYNTKTGRMQTFETDFAKIGACNQGGMYESPDGKVFIGTTSGLILYDRAKDQRPQIAPFNNINSITVNNVKYPFISSLTLPYNKRYSIWFDFVGINFSDPEKVWYQTKMDNLDDVWSKPSTDRRVPYSPRDGKYRFNIKSVNEAGESLDKPASFELIIKKPIWRTWWFILLSIGLISGIVILIVRQREKEQKKIQEYLEKELEARTSVVLKQKGVIELANLEITDSINYAKRIQTSILPDFNRVKEIFSDAFLLFRPRDIVSGDFYWFDKIDDERFILVCADSTGHGVPGAFMSMIGSTLLQDIVTRQHITQPSEILKMLDKQIFSTLNQNIELGVSNDGMDMVVCEVRVKTRHIRFASAMRPVILVLDGEPIYIKGNRSSVGGESVIEKYFDDQEYYLNPGDTIYLFSDGLPDQFGGTDGKKMKIARLKKLIEDVSDLPMDGQKAVITKFYDEWKGDYDQVDDILLIGVRL